MFGGRNVIRKYHICILQLLWNVFVSYQLTQRLVI